MSILAWAGGYAINKIRDVAIKKVTEVSLEDKLQKKVDQWLTKYGYPTYVSEALFNAYSKDDDDIGPARKALADMMQSSQVPTEEIWFEAIKERFESIQNSTSDRTDLQLLFQKDFSEIQDQIHELALSLKSVCIAETSYFQFSIFKMLEELRADLKRERPINALLTELADFLDNKRVLYQPFIREERNPLLPVILSAEQVRQHLSDRIIPQFGIDETGALVRRMLQTCRSFLDRLDELPLQVRQDGATPIMHLEWPQIELIEEAMFFFRGEFTAPLFWLLTKHGVEIPLNILYHTNLSHLDVPVEIFFNGLSIDTKKDIRFSGDEQTGYFLRIATLAQKTTLDNIEWPLGTELIFYDPLTTKTKNRIISAKPMTVVTILNKVYPAGEEIYLTLNGEVTDKFPEEESRYEYLGYLKRQQRS